MNKKMMAIVMATTTLGAVAADAPISVKWEIVGNDMPKGHYSSRVVFTNVSDSVLGGDWGFYYNNFPRVFKTGEECQFDVKEIVPNYYVMNTNERYVPLNPGDSVVVDLVTRGVCYSKSYRPDGGHFAFNGRLDKPMAAPIVFPVHDRPVQWSVPGKEFANYPDGKYMYELNASVNPAGASTATSVYNIFPTPKSIVETGGTLRLTESVVIEADAGSKDAKAYAEEKLKAAGLSIGNAGGATRIKLSSTNGNSENEEYYELTVGEGGIEISGATQVGTLNGVKTLVAVIETAWAKTHKDLPNVKITDYPDLGYRGVMIDIARNYTKYENILKMIDLYASYKINVLQFHFCDDEAWRIEIPGLPELTEVGGKKGLTLDEKDFLVQTYAGNGDPEDLTTTANGYLTRGQFITLLQYAASRGMMIIPEVETPGHARAAIVSMKHRYNKYIGIDKAKAEQYKLWDDEDESVYTSAQGYHDNVLNAASEGTYRFLEKVVNELIAMYEEAGLELKVLHIGGDEVASGSWTKSPMMQAMMQEKGLKDAHEAQEYFLERFTSFLSLKGIKAMGWQEVAHKRSELYNKLMIPRFAGINAWSTVGRNSVVPYELANTGYPVLLCNVTNFYFDMAYSRHQEEPGMTWGGVTDEYSSWEAQPYNIYRTNRVDTNGNPIDLAKAADGKVELKAPENIIGVQGQMWAETVRGFDMVQAYYFPKLFGLSERGWNATPAWGTQYDDTSLYYAERAAYNLKVGLKELPRLFNKGVHFHIGQPGVIVENGMVKVNTQYPGVVVRYTLDGSEPTRESAQWTAPVPCGDAKIVKARAYYLGKEGVTTYLFVE